MPDELSIGRFARLCRLSVKRLRHYEELGLLAPARVDPATGYRYYARTQVRDAMAIALLRTLDVPLPAIARVLTGDDGARAVVLEAEHARLAAEMERRRRTMQALERLLTDGLWSHDVGYAREPGRWLVATEAVCDVDGIGAATGRCVERLLESGVPVTSHLWGVFPVDLDAPLRIAVGVESDVDTAAGAPGGLVAEQLRPGPAAVTTHIGPYEHLPFAYQAVLAWIHERGLRPRGVAYEAYLTDPTRTAPDQLVTRLVVPVHEELT